MVVCKILHFTFLPRDPVELPRFMGSALRGIMGRQFLTHGNSGAYSELFSRVCEKSHDTPPNPYIIYHVGLTPRLAHEPLRFEVKLIGTAARFTEDVICALTDGCASGIAAGRHRFDLESVVEENVPIFQTESSFSGNQISLYFDTPLQIRTSQSGVMWKLDFELLIRNIQRRLKLFAIVDEDEKYADELAQRAKKIQITRSDMNPYYMERWSNRTESHKSLSGLVGEVWFEGALDEFIPYLRAGSIINAGKACTMGLGHFSIN